MKTQSDPVAIYLDAIDRLEIMVKVIADKEGQDVNHVRERFEMTTARLYEKCREGVSKRTVAQEQEEDAFYVLESGKELPEEVKKAQDKSECIVLEMI
jgi:hypothetical protein